MKFVDSASIQILAGKGGDGFVGFRREKFIPFGGPNGGDGGDGGSVIMMATCDLNTLSKYRIERIFKAKNGAQGGTNNKRGRSAQDLLIKMPLGTQVFNLETDEMIGELLTEGQTLTVAKGGFHGLGNTRFKSSVNRAPRQFTKGTPGEIRELGLELMVMADVGLLGLPNAGKSSLIRKVSQAKPKVANYPFTTIEPNLGVVYLGFDSFVMADIPGVIKGASIGVGLGFEFLKHLSRAQVLLHIVDILPADYSNPADNYQTIVEELEKYDKKLAQKPRVLAINKIDLIAKQDRQAVIDQFISDTGYEGDYFVISTMDNTDLQAMLLHLQTMVTSSKQQQIQQTNSPVDIEAVWDEELFADDKIENDQ